MNAQGLFVSSVFASISFFLATPAACQSPPSAATSRAALGRASRPAVKDLPLRVAMPDPLVADGGQRVTTVDQWRQRREQMIQILEEYEYGHMPPPPGNVKGHEVASKPLMDGKVKYRLVHLTFGPEEKLGFDLGIFTPAETATVKGPFPTLTHLLQFATQSGGNLLIPHKAMPPAAKS